MARSRFRLLAFLVLAPAVAAPFASAQAPAPNPSGPSSVAPPVLARSLDAFDDTSAWKALPSDGVEATIRTERRDDAHGNCLRLDFNFKTGGGFVVVRRSLPMPLPANYEFSFDVRGACLSNNFEFKLIDDGATRRVMVKDAAGAMSDAPFGESVWWVNKRAFEFPKEWTRVAYKRRRFSFAWGPSASAPLANLGAIEFAIASAEGGKGTVWIDDLTFRELPEVKEYAGSMSARDERREVVVRGEEFTPPYAPSSASSELTIDLGQPREFGGLRISWQSSPVLPMTETYDVLASSDAQNWTTLVRGHRAGAEVDRLLLPDTEARFIKLRSTNSHDDGALDRAPGFRPVRRFEVIPLEHSRDANAFLTLLARELPRGILPRWASAEQSFWTVLGVPDDTHEALINEEGQIEAVRGEFSIEPFVQIGNRVLTWADATHTQALGAGQAPVARVVRTMEGLTLSLRAAAVGPPNAAVLVAHYELTNTSEQPARGALALSLRPLQVNPPAQFLNMEGGIGRIDSLETSRALIVDVNGRPIIAVAGNGCAPRGFSARAELDGSGLVPLGMGDGLFCAPMGNARRCQGGEWVFAFALQPGATATCAWVMPFAGDRLPPWIGRGLNEGKLRQLLTDAEREWEPRTHRAVLRLPPSARAIEDTFYAQQAYILINKDGPGFQPGSRSYERSWIRDGSMTSAAMLQLGHDQLAKDFVDWYASFQFLDGKVPCVVDKRGPDPVPEHDSHGQLIMAIANVHRYTGDLAFVRRHMSHVEKAVAYIQLLRAQRSGSDYADNSGKTRQEPGKPAVPLAAFRGLVPESISHEGYSAKPMHSYWDDLFIYRGLKDAAYLARVTGDELNAARWQSLADEFARDLAASYALAMKTHKIDYLPGCVELGDFDATSTTVALWPVQAADILPPAALHRTFDKYWEFFTNRRDNPRDKWEAYTPYELRVINAFTHLGQRERAFAALEWFMQDQYPKGWHHWAEVVWSNPRTPKFIGDMPHTWCGSDFLNSLRSMLVYEDEANDSLVLFAGVPEAWKNAAEGLSFNGFRTYYGPLSAAISRHERGTRVHIESPDFRMPKGGIVLRWDDTKPPRATINGAPYEGDARHRPGDIVIRSLPADVVIIDD